MQRHSGWRWIDGEPDSIEKTWRFADFHHTMAFVNAVAAVAHQMDHHPDLAVSYSRCSVRWSTHDAGGVTARDLAAARAVDALREAASSPRN